MMAGVMFDHSGAPEWVGCSKFFPYRSCGFTSGIAIIIFLRQLNEFLGLGLKCRGTCAANRGSRDSSAEHQLARVCPLRTDPRDRPTLAVCYQARAGEHRRGGYGNGGVA